MLCVAAILKHEGRFVEEWLAYHRLLGVDHFFLYDNDPELPLRQQLRAHASHVTIVDWLNQPEHLPGRNKQTKAYENAIHRAHAYEWIAFIDVDEFIVLRQDQTLPQFLARFPQAGAVLLNWHYFGHNGHYHDPKGLVIEVLTRRRRQIGRMSKSINRVAAIRSVRSAHDCHLWAGKRAVDANGKPYAQRDYPGKSDLAHVNHYVCRSFTHWMKRVARGDAAFEPGQFPPEHRWRCTPEGCLQQFVQTVAKDMNELPDEYLVTFAAAVRAYLDTLSAGTEEAEGITGDK